MTTSRQDKAGRVADDELLRLARKAWPDSERIVVSVDDAKDREPFVEIYGEHGGYKSVEVCMHDRAQQAIHAALLVLSGELDVAALLAELDRLREENRR